MIGFGGADCILLALALAAIAIGRDQFGALRSGVFFNKVYNIPIRQ